MPGECISGGLSGKSPPLIPPYVAVCELVVTTGVGGSTLTSMDPVVLERIRTPCNDIPDDVTPVPRPLPV